MDLVYFYDEKLDSEEKLHFFKEETKNIEKRNKFYRSEVSHLKQVQKEVEETSQVYQEIQKIIDYILSRVKCRRCKKEDLWGSEIPYYIKDLASPYAVCSSCRKELEEKQKKTFGWIFYHFLKLEKVNGKMILNSSMDFAEDKYGLQAIYVDHYLNKVAFEFYFGRSFSHRPKILIPLKDIQKNKQILREMVEASSLPDYTCEGRMRQMLEKANDLPEFEFGDNSHKKYFEKYFKK